MKARVQAVAATALTLVAGLAHADQQEASVHVEATSGFARVGEERTSAIDTVPLAGANARLTYGVRDALSLDAELGFAHQGTGHFDGAKVTFAGTPGADGPVERSAQLVRLLVGGTLRLGVRWVPTVSVGVGPQVRLRGDGMYLPTGNVPDDHAAGVAVDLLATARVGLDVRVNRHWLAGAWVGGAYAVPLGGPSFQSAEGGLRVEYNWYPLIW